MTETNGKMALIDLLDTGLSETFNLEKKKKKRQGCEVVYRKTQNNKLCLSLELRPVSFPWQTSLINHSMLTLRAQYSSSTILKPALHC